MAVGEVCEREKVTILALKLFELLDELLERLLDFGAPWFSHNSDFPLYGGTTFVR